MRIASAFFVAAAALALPARAEPVIQPIPNAVADAFPPATTLLPTNSALFFLGVGFADATFSRGGAFIEPSDRMFNAFVIVPAELSPPVTPGETFTISAQCFECDLSRTWTMGTEADTEAPALDEGAIVETVSLTVTKGVSAAYVWQLVVPAIRDEQPRVIVIDDGEGIRKLFPAARAAATVVTHEFGADLEATGERCIDIAAADIALNRINVATHCVRIDDATDVTTPSCAQLPFAPFGGLALLTLFSRARGHGAGRRRPSSSTSLPARRLAPSAHSGRR